MYRYFDAEIFGVDDGGTFGWHNGAFGSTSTLDPSGYGGKCWDPGSTGNGGTGATTVTADVWLYTWDKADSM